MPSVKISLAVAHVFDVLSRPARDDRRVAANDSHLQFTPTDLDVEVIRNGWCLWVRVAKRFSNLSMDIERSPAARQDPGPINTILLGATVEFMNSRTQRWRVGIVGHQDSPYWTKMILFTQTVLPVSADHIAERDALVRAVNDGTFDAALEEAARNIV
jgi:hypothetical protein